MPADEQQMTPDMDSCDRQPDETVRVPVHGHEVVAYSIGSGDEVLLCVNGGPGLACDYVRDSHSRLASDRYRVVAYDQLGCGASDRPDDDSLWTIERHAEELEIVRNSLGLGKVHLLGHSWGAWLGVEYALAYPESCATLMLVGGAASIPHLLGELERLRSALGPETVEMMKRHEAEGTLEHPEYRGALDILYYRHLCRLQTWPDAVMRSVNSVNTAPYNVIQGPSEFYFTGNIRNWDRLGDMHRIAIPSLVLCGRHDICTPACSQLMHEALPDSELVVFPESAHLAFFEEPEAYFATLGAFLERHPA